MAKPLKYPWDRLKIQGDYVVLEGIEPAKVKTAAVLYLRRHLGNDVRVTVQPIPEGTIVVLLWAPEPLPQTVKLFVKDEITSEKSEITLEDFGKIIELEKSPSGNRPRWDDDEDPDEDIRQYLDD